MRLAASARLPSHIPPGHGVKLKPENLVAVAHVPLPHVALADPDGHMP